MTRTSISFLKLYRLVLTIYPRPFRIENAEEMIETVAARAMEKRARYGPLGMVRFWSKELSAAFRSGTRLRFADAGLHRPSTSETIAHTRYDLRFAFRSLRRSPVFTLTAALTVALGIGATIVIFSFVNGVLLSPLPYNEPAGLVVFRTHNGTGTDVSEPEFMAFRTEARSLESVAAVRDVSRTVQLDVPRRVGVLQTTHELFPMLGVPPMIGRTFTSSEDLRGAPLVTILSHSLWQEMYGGDPGVLGQSIMLDGESYEVVGVMPSGFYFPSPEIVMWSPYQIDPANLDNWNNHYLGVYGRLEDGVSLEAARTEIRAMGERFVAEHPEFLESLGFTSDLELQYEYMVGATRAPLLVLFGAVGFLLLIGCTNVANLLLARGENRKQEIAVRGALGASRGRLVSQLLVESVVLSGIGGMMGFGLAFWGVQTLRTALASAVPRVEEIGIDPFVLLFTAGVTILTGLLFGLLPAISAGRLDLQTQLTESGRTLSSSRRSRLARRVLVAAEVALSVVLVVGAGVMLRSLANLQRIDTGFRTEDILTMRVSPPLDENTEGHVAVRFYDELVERVEALPGVVSAGVVGRLPLLQGIGRWSIQVEGQEVSAVGEAPTSEEQQVTAGYFETMGLTLLEGRFLTHADDAGIHPVAVVNEAFARLHWPGESALGRRIKLYSRRLPWLNIVGVVKNERHRDLLSDVQPKMYLPHAQASTSTYDTRITMNLVIQGEGVETLARSIRAIVGEMNSAAPVYNVQTMEDVRSASMMDRSYPTILLSLFGLLALFLASIGIYGLVAFQVNEGKQDLGIRVALGATGANVQRMVVVSGLKPVLLGIALGLMGAVGLTRVLNSLLYEVSPIDAPVYLGVSVVLLLVAATACIVPAARAMRLDPVEVLRAE